MYVRSSHSIPFLFFTFLLFSIQFVSLGRIWDNILWPIFQFHNSSVVFCLLLNPSIKISIFIVMYFFVLVLFHSFSNWLYCLFCSIQIFASFPLFWSMVNHSHYGLCLISLISEIFVNLFLCIFFPAGCNFQCIFPCMPMYFLLCADTLWKNYV